MFWHRHDPQSLAERVDELMAAVFVVDDGERMEKLRRNLAPGFVYMSPQTVVEGADGLSEAFSRFRHDPMSHPSLRRTSGIDVHHAHFRYSWERTEHGKTSMEGWSFGWMDDAGLIARIVSFDGLVPGLSS